MFKFNCPFCRQEIEAEDEWVGQVADCPNCGRSIDIKRPARQQVAKQRGNVSRVANATRGTLNPVIDIDYKRNAKYFGKPWLVIILTFFLGIPLTVFGGIGSLVLRYHLITLGIGLLCVCLAYVLQRKRARDFDIDLQVSALSSQLRTKALKRLGLTEEGAEIVTDPVEVWAFAPTISLDDKVIRWLTPVKGEDGIWRSPEVHFSAFYFSEDRMYYYYWVASLVSDSFREGTVEMSYTDIASVKTERERIPIGKLKVSGRKSIQYDSFALVNTAGEEISCLVRDYSDAERAVTGIRAIIREDKKRG